MLLKVGALAKKTGLTVRTLHHYDEIGLLTPSHRSEAGYRLYTCADLARLHHIQALKQFGFALVEIGEILANQPLSVVDIIDQQLQILTQQAEHIERLRQQLGRMKTHVQQGKPLVMADWLATLELMSMYEKYFSPEEIKVLEQHRQQAGADLDARWAELVKTMQALYDRGVAAEEPQVQQYAAEWTALAQQTVGNDTSLLIKMDAMTRQEQAIQQQSGITPELLDYVMAAIVARQASIYQRYLTPQELTLVNQGRMATAKQWPPLVYAMRQLLNQGLSVSHPQVHVLAQQWQTLLEQTYPQGDGQLRIKLRQAYAQEPELLRGTGLDMALLEFVGRAMAALGQTTCVD